MGGFSNRKVFLMVLEAGKSRMKVPVGLVRALSLDCTATFSMRPHMVFP